MKPEDHYLKFVTWSDEDAAYIGWCPDLFPWGGVCHASSEEECYHQLCELVREEVSSLVSVGKNVPKPMTRPMKEVLAA